MRISNPLGRRNRLVPLTDTEKYWHIELEAADKSNPNSQFGRAIMDGYLSLKNKKILKIIGAGTLLSPPGNPGCMVILFEDYGRYVIYYRFSDKQWTQRWIGKEILDIGHEDDVEDSIYQESITYCEREFYAATYSNSYLMMIKENRFNNLELRPLNCRFPIISSHHRGSFTYLLDFWGQLCFVEISNGGVNDGEITDIDVLKLEFSGNRKRWVRVKSAEDRAFFISHKYAFSCPVNEPEIKGGHVYLFLDKRLCSINIKDKSFTASLPLQNLSELENSPLLAMRDLIRLCNPQAKPEHPISKLEVENEGIVIEDNNEERANNPCDLPSDVLLLIAKKLHRVDYISFRSVCRKFRLVPYIKWSEASFKLLSPSLSPWLVFHRGNSCASHNFVDPQSCSEYRIKIPERILNGKVRHCKDGWLLICSPRFMFFYHPFTKELRELPQGVGRYNFCVGYGLSSSPDSADYILVGNDVGHICYFSRKEGQWFEYQFPDYYDFESNHNSPIYYDGAFYFLGVDGTVAVFRRSDGEVSWKILKELQSPCVKYRYNYLLECGGDLLSVFVVDQMVHIYKLNFTNPMTWERMTGLGNHALFVSPSSSFSVIAHSSDMENKVYFRKLYGKDIVYYCLSTDKFYTCGKKEVVVDFYNTKEFFYSTWIEPRSQL
ncbi:hypothetical protein PTKIN_Ptkin14bG0045700 [Pterospermum kingtungense]